MVFWSLVRLENHATPMPHAVSRLRAADAGD